MSRLCIYSFTSPGYLSQKCYGWVQDTRCKTIDYLKQTNKFPTLSSVEDSSTIVFSVDDVEISDESDLWKAVLYAHRATPDFTISMKIRGYERLLIVEQKNEV